ncbi:leucine-rich repeat domain-containing protein [Fluviicola sp.]|jgi:Leucine-rich repeat (LRR) protein|uniref:leucine-rich repeat domain-containing protein n=1 Tax=Fluviicola sp. TaxID=1917219 RepID=UPI00281C1756|nr:leucine-rich repeat domain-containing protein [Fluviicola sp.]MDR0802404.1 leucine-rich repeat domain-containing protein [Fluviicola sp.]
MKLLLAITFLHWSSLLLAQQDTLKIYRWEEVQKANPDTIFAIDASKLKWEKLPGQLYTFRNLKYLDISKNKLKELPLEMGGFKQLKILDATKNNIDAAPIVICQLPKLQKLHLAKNKISSLPACIGYLADLKMIDIWDNPINVLPEEILNLKKLEVVDMRSIMLGPGFQKKWEQSMPNVKWYFDPPCHCVE